MLVQAPASTSPLSSADHYSYQVLPTISGITPGYASVSGGSSLTITGTGFTGPVTVLFGSVPARMVQFTRHSPRFAAIMQDLFAGRQPYLGLKKRLLENLNPSLYEIAMSFSGIVPKARRV